LLANALSTAGAFGSLILCGRRGAEAVSYEDLAGHARSSERAEVQWSASSKPMMATSVSGSSGPSIAMSGVKSCV
jgi:hypothetical protein